MSQRELWQWVHYNYGEDLGLTSDDDVDYVSMSAVDRIQFQMRIQREEKLSQQQNADSVTQPTDIIANKVNWLWFAYSGKTFCLLLMTFQENWKQHFPQWIILDFSLSFFDCFYIFFKNNLQSCMLYFIL